MGQHLPTRREPGLPRGSSWCSHQFLMLVLESLGIQTTFRLRGAMSSFVFPRRREVERWKAVVRSDKGIHRLSVERAELLTSHTDDKQHQS